MNYHFVKTISEINKNSVSAWKHNAGLLSEQTQVHTVQFNNANIAHQFDLKGMVNSFINPNFSCEEIAVMNKAFLNLTPRTTITDLNISKKRYNLVLQIENDATPSICTCAFESIKKQTKTKQASGTKIMSQETAFASILNILYNKPDADQYSIHFLGQDPIHYKKLITDIAEYAYREIVIIRQKKVNFIIHSHTAAFSSDILDFFHDYDFTVMVGFNQLEYIPETVLENIRQLQEVGIKTYAHIALNSLTNNYVKIFDFFEKREIPYVYSFKTTNAPAKNLFKESSYEIADLELKKSMDYFIAKMLSNQQIYCTDFIYKMAMLNLGIVKEYGCEAGRSYITVNTNGDYYTCQNLVDASKTKIGNIDSMIDKQQVKKYQSPDIGQLDYCKKCLVRSLCGGGCHADRYNAKKGSNQQCRLSYIEWKNTLYAYAQWSELHRH